MLLYGNQMHGGEGSDNVLSRHLSFSDLIVLVLVNSVNAFSNFIWFHAVQFFAPKLNWFLNGILRFHLFSRFSICLPQPKINHREYL